jgi:hypothetical protein
MLPDTSLFGRGECPERFPVTPYLTLSSLSNFAGIEPSTLSNFGVVKKNDLWTLK